jgi:superfamily I DNA/RNA helicase
MENVNIIIGPPGTGKTTELLNLINSALSKGIDPQKIGFVSFTKKSVEEAKARAAVKFNTSLHFFNYFRTIHSLAFYQLSMNKASVIEKSHYKEIGDLLGITIRCKNTQDYSVEELEKGDQLVFIESLSRMRCETLEQTYNREMLDFSYLELQVFQETFIRYKKVNRLYDFTDMLTRFYDTAEVPELDMLFVDEAQDLCALQWRIIERMIGRSKTTYIAGDDDQAIFRWSGADIEYFIDLSREHNTKVLSQSYRVPIAVHELADDLINGVKARVTKSYQATPAKGSVEFVSSIEDVDLDKGEWLILVRNTYMINPIIEHLRLSGYTYTSKYKNSNNSEILQAAMNYEKLKKGEEVSYENIKILLSYMSIRRAIGNLPQMKSTTLLTLSDVKKHVKFKTELVIWHEMLDRINVEDREYIIAVRRRGGSFLTKPRLTVSTIHGAKGGECENVLLFTDMSIRTYKAMNLNYEDEIRVFYVGITRAKTNLYIVQQNTNCAFQI